MPEKVNSSFFNTIRDWQYCGLLKWVRPRRSGRTLSPVEVIEHDFKSNLEPTGNEVAGIRQHSAEYSRLSLLQVYIARVVSNKLENNISLNQIKSKIILSVFNNNCLNQS